MPRRKTAAWTLLGVAVLAATATAAWRTSDLGRAAADLDPQLAAARREGVPTAYADVVRLAPRLPDEDNAAALYRQAASPLRASGGLRGLRASHIVDDLAAGKTTAADLAILRDDLRAIAPALAEAKAGARRKGLFFDRRWQAGEALTFPEYDGLWNLHRALVLRAMIATDPDAAVDDLRAAARMRAQVGAEPVTMAALEGNRMEGGIHRALRFLGRRGGAWPRAVAPVLDALGPFPNLHRSLTFEVVDTIHFGDAVKRYGAMSFAALGGPETPPVMRLMALRSVRDAAEARIVGYWRAAWSRLPEDPADYRAARRAMTLPSAQGPSYALLDLLPSLDGFATANATTEANRRLTRTALALWSGATPALPEDPFGKGPLKLRRDEGRWTLYSVGPDEHDDGGKPLIGSGMKGYDLVVRE